MLLLRKLYGTAIILVTHNIGVIRAMADTVLVLKEGNMVEYGPAEQVLYNPEAELYERTFGSRADAAEELDGAITGNKKSDENIQRKRKERVCRGGSCEFLRLSP